LQASLMLPRYHQQWLPDEIRVEEGFDPAIAGKLEAKGHVIHTQDLGCKVQAASMQSQQSVSAFSDMRGAGKALAF
ncbi:MAG: gamma-glutamyltransferase, partial [Deltaproteobacteria bacterium]|nr:gamma-glutamyltransferase [Deltaproteobacteria bacterium]